MYQGRKGESTMSSDICYYCKKKATRKITIFEYVGLVLFELPVCDAHYKEKAP